MGRFFFFFFFFNGKCGLIHKIRPKPDYYLHCSHGQVFGLEKLCPLANFKSFVSVPALVNHLLDSKKCL